jgi:hypothetical protein
MPQYYYYRIETTLIHHHGLIFMDIGTVGLLIWGGEQEGYPSAVLFVERIPG